MGVRRSSLSVDVGTCGYARAGRHRPAATVPYRSQPALDSFTPLLPHSNIFDSFFPEPFQITNTNPLTYPLSIIYKPPHPHNMLSRTDS